MHSDPQGIGPFGLVIRVLNGKEDFMKSFWRKLLCIIGDHEWTCKAEQGIKPTKEELTNPLVGFAIYSRMYCKHCGKVSHLSI